MLEKLKEELQDLTEQQKEQFKAEYVKRAGNCDNKELNALFNFIKIMPILVNRIYYFWNKYRFKSIYREFGGFMMAYLYHDSDFLPVQKYKHFGYLDDAYFVSLLYQQVLSEIILMGKEVELKDWELLKSIDEAMPVIYKAIPEEMNKIKALYYGVASGDRSVFESLFAA